MGLIKKVNINPLKVPSASIIDRRLPMDNFPLFTKGDSPDVIVVYVLMMAEEGRDMSSFRYDDLARPLVLIDP